ITISWVRTLVPWNLEPAFRRRYAGMPRGDGGNREGTRGVAMVWHRVYRFALSIAMSALTLTAQTGSGRVQGVVTDASSAVVAGAKVTILHTATMREYATTANEAGLFLFPPVQPGSYEITATSPGLETWKGAFLLAVG